MILQTLLLSIVAITPLEVDPALSSLNGTFEQSTFMPGAIIAAWGPCDGCTEDLNNDGNVDVNDLLEVIANWSGS
jgi:hypothetical protein